MNATRIDEQRLVRAYQLVLCREPSAHESRVLLEIYQQALSRFRHNKSAAEKLLEAYRRMIWKLVNSGFNPILSPPDDYEEVVCWAEILSMFRSFFPIFLAPNVRSNSLTIRVFDRDHQKLT